MSKESISNMPKKVGTYWMACLENNYKLELTKVFDKEGFLMVEYNGGEQNSLEAVHQGLTDIRWLKY